MYSFPFVVLLSCESRFLEKDWIESVYFDTVFVTIYKQASISVYVTRGTW